MMTQATSQYADSRLKTLYPQIAKFMGQHGAHLGPLGPRWAPCWPHEPYYQGVYLSSLISEPNGWFGCGAPGWRSGVATCEIVGWLAVSHRRSVYRLTPSAELSTADTACPPPSAKSCKFALWPEDTSSPITYPRLTKHAFACNTIKYCRKITEIKGKKHLTMYTKIVFQQWLNVTRFLSLKYPENI